MTKRIGVVFPGYGEQFIGMGKDLYDQSRTVQEFFEQAAGTANTNFVKLCFASSDQEISSTRYAYLAIYLFESSLYQVLYEQGLRPDFVAGYGIGEYTACFASQSLSFIDGLYFLNKYSQFYTEFLESKEGKGLSVLKITRDFNLTSLQELIGSVETKTLHAYIAAQNTEHGFYVSGQQKALEKIEKYCKKEVIRKVRMLGPEHGMHSELMDSVVERLKLYYHKIQFKALKTPVITNVDGVYVTSPDALQSAVMRRINNRIEWYEIIKGFEGCDVIVSVGPGEQLIEWFKEVYPDKEYVTISSLKDIDKAKELLELDSFVSSPEQEEKDLTESDSINEKPSDYDTED